MDPGDNVQKRVRIGLLRHFQVAEPFPTGWKTAADLEAWRSAYDLAEPIAGDFDLGGVDWTACFSSDMLRTRLTASAVFRGPIVHSPLLREAEFSAFQTGNLRLPIWARKWTLRLSWITGHRSQRACRDEFRSRVRAVADQLCATEEDTLVVSHAGMMAYLSWELRRRGFIGPKLRIAKYARAYVYHNGH
jgi:broad specificity phosphatase PhoE